MRAWEQWSEKSFGAAKRIVITSTKSIFYADNEGKRDVLVRKGNFRDLPHAHFPTSISPPTRATLSTSEKGREACRVNLFGWLRRRQSKSPSERLPWYRAPGYSGNLTEAQKRALDSFRMLADHPAFEPELPEHVELCITGLQLEVYDLKQERAAVRAFTTTLVGAAILYIAHFGAAPSNSIWSYLIGIGLMILPWVVYRSEWRKNADANLFASEAILMEWELDHVANAKLAAKHRSNDPPSTWP
jgi:hypothetical protein